MKRSSILRYFIVFCLCIVLSQGVGASAAPQIEVIGGPTFDFGDVQANKTLTHEFVFNNTGDSMLRIQQVKGGWGCTASLLSSDEIPPGSEGKIAVTVRSGYRRQNLRQSVRVQTNDPNNEMVTLTVTANVLVDLEVIPNLLRFEQNQPRASVTIKNYSEHAIQLSNIQSSIKDVDISVSSLTVPPQGEIVVTASLLPDVSKGILSGWITIHTDLKPMPVIQIRVWGNLP